MDYMTTTHGHYYDSVISDWWCRECDTVTDYCTENSPSEHPADCGYCMAGEPMVHNYEPGH